MKKTWVIVGVVIVAVLLVGGTLLTGCGRSDAKAGGSTSASGDVVAPDRSADTSSGGSTNTSSKGGGSLPPQTNPAALKRVKALPAHTTAFVDGGKFTPNSSYKVTFVPYGTGLMPKSLVVNVSASAAIGKVAHPFDFAGKDALVSMRKLSAKTTVKKGGRYAGTIKLVNDGGVLLPTFTAVSSAK